MICQACWNAGHYWFSDVMEKLAEEDPDEYEAACEELGEYGYCDARQVFNGYGPCECGCHEHKTLKHIWPANDEIK